MAMEFFRQPTPEDLTHFTGGYLGEVKQQTINRIFERKLTKVDQEYTKNMKPFCAKCARLDFKDQLKKHKDELFRKVRTHFSEEEKNTGYGDLEKIDIDINLDEYGDPKRFKVIREEIASEPITVSDLAAGKIQRLVKIGIHRDFRCKIRGCGRSVFLSNEVLKNEKTIKIDKTPNKK